MLLIFPLILSPTQVFTYIQAVLLPTCLSYLFSILLLTFIFTCEYYPHCVTFLLILDYIFTGLRNDSFIPSTLTYTLNPSQCNYFWYQYVFPSCSLFYFIPFDVIFFILFLFSLLIDVASEYKQVSRSKCSILLCSIEKSWSVTEQ